LLDNARVAWLEVAVSRTVVPMIEATIILILMLGVLLPVLLILMPVLGGNGTAQQDAESYQWNRQSHCSPSLLDGSNVQSGNQKTFSVCC
jgi:hypothetical protein